MLKRQTFERLLYINSLLSTGLKVGDVALRLTVCRGSLRGYHSFALFDINLVSEYNLYVALDFLKSKQ